MKVDTCPFKDYLHKDNSIMKAENMQINIWKKKTTANFHAILDVLKFPEVFKKKKTRKVTSRDLLKIEHSKSCQSIKQHDTNKTGVEKLIIWQKAHKQHTDDKQNMLIIKYRKLAFQ